MKTCIYPIIALLMLGVFTSCLQEHEGPPLTEPKYTGAPANVTIAQLRERYGNITDNTLIDIDFILRATVSANDISGNIFNQLYLQDETGGIIVNVARSSLFSDFRVGQEVFIRLHGLYMITSGGGLQIGFDGTHANRIPWEVFDFFAFKNGWPQANRVTPRLVTLDALDESMMATLVQLDNVFFDGRGELTFGVPGSPGGVNRTLRDANGNTLTVRNSNLSNFAANTLPDGAGTVVGMLSQFNNNWQIFLRSIDDVKNFGQPIPQEPIDPDVTVFFKETFGTSVSSPWPTIAEYNGFDNTDVTFTDPTGRITVRSTGFPTPHLWFPAPSASVTDAVLLIKGIDTSEGADEELILTFELGADVREGATTSVMNLNAMSVFVNDTPLEMPSHEVTFAGGDRSVPFLITLTGIPAQQDLILEFRTGAGNTAGMRLDNIAITSKPEGSEIIVIRPVR